MSVPDCPTSKTASFPDNQRAAVRSRAHLPVFLVTPAGDAYSAFLTNVSCIGFRIRSEYRVTIGRFLTVDLPGLARYPGWVAWANADEFGLDVADFIPKEVIDQIVATAAEVEPLRRRRPPDREQETVKWEGDGSAVRMTAHG
jgi:hypothetical protein